MKKKEIKKIAKKIVELVKESDNKKSIKKQYLDEPIPSREEPDFGYCEHDEGVSQKFSKFVLNLIKIKDKVNINLYESGFDIFCDLNKFKTSNKQYNTENTFDIRIDKIGFRIRRNYSNWTSYKDATLFDSIKDQIIEKNQIVSKGLIFETIDDLTVELNLSRENNLEEILA